MNSQNDETITAKTIKEVTDLKDNSKVNSGTSLNLGPDSRSAKSAEGSIRQYKRHKDFDLIRSDGQKNRSEYEAKREHKTEIIGREL